MIAYMEVIISSVILSVVMITLLQIKSDNIYLVSKSEQKIKLNDYILLAIDSKDEILNKNEDLRKDIKVSIEDEKIFYSFRTYNLNYTIYDNSYFFI